MKLEIEASEVSRIVSAKLATYYKIIPLRIDGSQLVVASAKELSNNETKEIGILLGRQITSELASREWIAENMLKLYGVGAETIEEIDSKTSKLDDEKDAFDLSEQIEGISKYVNQLFVDALAKNASDLHIETYENRMKLRLRIDGVLHELSAPTDISHWASQITSRIKVMAELDIGETRLPQDGRIQVISDGEKIDIRVSVLPTPHGESVVLRFLRSLKLLELDDLGFMEDDIQILNKTIQKPNGLVLLTGPTGSGKTTTLYSCLSKINRPDIKIVTIEDPIEYNIDGVLQMQVKPTIGFDFPKALRSILRHDPDVIMVGEIRDKETAKLAFSAAMTGHLVFSTLHTNDASSAIARLRDMEIEPYLIASTLQLVVAQRLIRKLDQTHGEQGLSLSPSYKGRTVIYEMMSVNENLREVISKDSASLEIRRVADQSGFKGFSRCVKEKVERGITTIDEANKVLG